jgi:hypothetical protein
MFPLHPSRRAFCRPARVNSQSAPGHRRRAGRAAPVACAPWQASRNSEGHCDSVRTRHRVRCDVRARHGAIQPAEPTSGRDARRG